MKSADPIQESLNEAKGEKVNEPRAPDIQMSGTGETESPLDANCRRTPCQVKG